MAPRIIKKKLNIENGIISYKNSDHLAKFMNDRAKVYGRKQTGLSAKKQRLLTQEIKRARQLGLLPFKAHI